MKKFLWTPDLDSPGLAETLCAACPLLHGFSSLREFLGDLFARHSSRGNSCWSQHGDHEGWNPIFLRRMKTDVDPRTSCCLKRTWRAPGEMRDGAFSGPGCQSAHFSFWFLPNHKGGYKSFFFSSCTLVCCLL